MSHSINSGDTRIDADASPDRIEQQIDDKRARIDRTLEQLEDKLSPKQMMNQGMDLFRDHGGDVADSLGRSFRENPAPFIVTGVGLAWLIAATSSRNGQSNGGRYSSRYGYDDGGRFDELDDDDGYYDADVQDGNDRVRYSRTENSYLASGGFDTEGSPDPDDSLLDKAGDKLSDLGDKTSDMAADVASRYHGAKRRGAEHSRRMRRQMRSGARSIRDGGSKLGSQARYHAGDVSEFLKEQPLVAGSLGLAVGALIGSLLPATDVEDEQLGEMSDRVARQASRQAAQGAERVREEVEVLADKARDAGKDRIDEVDRRTGSGNEPSSSAVSARDSDRTEPA